MYKLPGEMYSSNNPLLSCRISSLFFLFLLSEVENFILRLESRILSCCLGDLQPKVESTHSTMTDPSKNDIINSITVFFYYRFLKKHLLGWETDERVWGDTKLTETNFRKLGLIVKNKQNCDLTVIWICLFLQPLNWNYHYRWLSFH